MYHPCRRQASRQIFHRNIPPAPWRRLLQILLQGLMSQRSLQPCCLPDTVYRRQECYTYNMAHWLHLRIPVQHPYRFLKQTILCNHQAVIYLLFLSPVHRWASPHSLPRRNCPFHLINPEPSQHRCRELSFYFVPTYRRISYLHLPHRIPFLHS